MKLYDDGRITILNGDCLAEIDNIGEKIDLIITSPPYNMTYRKGGYADRKKRYDSYEDWIPENDYLEWISRCFDKFDEILKDDGVILFNFSYSIENPSLPYKVMNSILNNTNFNLVDTIIWKKKCGVPFPANKYRLSRIWEFIFVFVKKGYENGFQIHKKVKSISQKTNQKYYEVIYNYFEARNNDGANDLNQATFSSDMVDKLLDIYSDENTIVLDPFMGTGTTGFSCKRRGIRFYGIEISYNQCVFSLDRLQNQ